VERLTEDDVLLTFKEVEDLLRVSRATVYRLLWSGQLIGHKVGKGWRFYKADLRKLVMSGTPGTITGPAAVAGIED
jgi:excisionase family DNA binding protein